MNVMKAVVKFLTNAKPVATLDALESGRAIAEGVVKKSETGFMLSPLKSQPCVAFHYQSIHFVGSRSGQMMPKQLKLAEGYHSFELELEGGSLQAIPKKNSDFGPREHLALSSAGYEGFRATEDIVPLGAKVRIHGVAKQNAEQQWTLTYHQLELLEAKARTAPAPKKRKKKST